MMESALKKASLFAVRLFLRVRLNGVRGETARQRIYCANHTSHLDALLVLAALPAQLRQRTRPVAAADYWRSGGLRRYVGERIFRTVLIEREVRELYPLEPALQALRQGDSLILFPEGTRGPGGGLQPLKPGIYHLARAFPEVEVVPVWIGNAHRVFPKHARVPVPATCTLAFGAPLRWDGAAEAAEFLERLRAAMELARG